MWFRKKKSEPLECVGCGCLMREAWRTVEVLFESTPGDTGGTYWIYSPPHLSTEPYCGCCAPPYDKKSVAGNKVRYYRKEPAKNVEITEKGKAIS